MATPEPPAHTKRPGRAASEPPPATAALHQHPLAPMPSLGAESDHSLVTIRATSPGAAGQTDIDAANVTPRASAEQLPSKGSYSSSSLRIPDLRPLMGPVAPYVTAAGGLIRRRLRRKVRMPAAEEAQDALAESADGAGGARRVTKAETTDLLKPPAPSHGAADGASSGGSTRPSSRGSSIAPASPLPPPKDPAFDRRSADVSQTASERQHQEDSSSHNHSHARTRGGRAQSLDATSAASRSTSALTSGLRSHTMTAMDLLYPWRTIAETFRRFSVSQRE